MTKDTHTAPQGELTLRTLAMPRDVNTNGDIFGGWVLSQMDIAAGIVAGSRANGRVATVAAMSCVSMSRLPAKAAPRWGWRSRPGCCATARACARR